MKKRKPKIIKDKKKRGEWAESVFMARASEQGLPVSKPWGDSKSYDCVVGSPGKFVAVQVKCTISELRNGEGYVCSMCSSHKAYRAGAFDFAAAYVVFEDAWYIIPAKEIRGMKSICLCTQGNEAKYEKYREAWHLLRRAAGLGEEEDSAGDSAEKESGAGCSSGESGTSEAATGGFPSSALARMKAAANYFQRYLEGGIVGPQKKPEDV
jgi:hypothetical protein